MTTISSPPLTFQDRLERILEHVPHDHHPAVIAECLEIGRDTLMNLAPKLFGDFPDRTRAELAALLETLHGANGMIMVRYDTPQFGPFLQQCLVRGRTLDQTDHEAKVNVLGATAELAWRHLARKRAAFLEAR